MAIESQSIDTQIPRLTTDAPFAPPESAAHIKDAAERRLYEDAYAAVVQLRTERGTGTGFFVDDKGHIVTAAHVVEDARETVAITVNGKVYSAKIVDISDTTDLAKLQLQGFDGTNQKYLKLADNSHLTTDQSVYAIGYPKGFQPAYLSPGQYKTHVTVYDLVNKDKTAAQFKAASKTERDDLLKALSGKVMQGAVHVEGGNSGGPLLNSEGRVVGVVDIASQGDVTVSYYRPVEDVQSLLGDKKTSGFTITYSELRTTAAPSSPTRDSVPSAPTPVPILTPDHPDLFAPHQPPAIRYLLDGISRTNGDPTPPFSWRSINLKRPAHTVPSLLAPASRK